MGNRSGKNTFDRIINNVGMKLVTYLIDVLEALNIS